MISIHNIDFREYVNNHENIELLYIDPPYNTSDKLYDKQENNYYEFLKSIFLKFSNFKTAGLFNEGRNSDKIMRLCDELGYTIIMPIIGSRSSPGKAGQRYKMNYEMIYGIIKDKNNFVFNRQYNQMVGKQVLPYYDSDGSPKGGSYNEDGNRVREAEIGSVGIYPEDKQPLTLEADGIKKRVEQISDIWFDTRPFGSMPEKTSHTCQKPQSLINRIITTSTNENDLIVDPFAGTFSCGYAANKLNRNYVGIEINKDNYDEGLLFINNGKGKKSIRNKV